MNDVGTTGAAAPMIPYDVDDDAEDPDPPSEDATPLQHGNAPKKPSDRANPEAKDCLERKGGITIGGRRNV